MQLYYLALTYPSPVLTLWKKVGHRGPRWQNRTTEIEPGVNATDTSEYNSERGDYSKATGLERKGKESDTDPFLGSDDRIPVRDTDVSQSPYCAVGYLSRIQDVRKLYGCVHRTTPCSNCRTLCMTRRRNIQIWLCGEGKRATVNALRKQTIYTSGMFWLYHDLALLLYKEESSCYLSL